MVEVTRGIALTHPPVLLEKLGFFLGLAILYLQLSHISEMWSNHKPHMVVIYILAGFLTEWFSLPTGLPCLVFTLSERWCSNTLLLPHYLIS